MDRRYKERMPQFRELPGLVQKYYSYDEATGEWAGIYLWDSEESLAAYLESADRTAPNRALSARRRASDVSNAIARPG